MSAAPACHECTSAKMNERNFTTPIKAHLSWLHDSLVQAGRKALGYSQLRTQWD